jgi:hypothetical protein
MGGRGLLILFALLCVSVPAPVASQAWAPERLPLATLDVVPPSAWVQGAPGQMRMQAQSCRSFPMEQLRRRIVDVAVQEWAFFGFPVLDRANGARVLPPGAAADPGRPFLESTTRRAPLLNPGESARVAASIAGYWAVTSEGPGIVDAQNRVWNGRGVDARWNAPWSAAFVSWVMCEAGLGSREQFQRAIAHRTYIDQAIRARDGGAPHAAYVAYDVEERPVEPGDLLCTSRRPQYRNLAERRRQMGVGARTHCDIVVEVDPARGRILAVGGNVLRSVSLKVLPAVPDGNGGALVRPTSSAPVFAHLKLKADPIDAAALSSSPVLAALTCTSNGAASERAVSVVAQLEVGRSALSRC